MAMAGLRRLASHEARGAHFYAVLFMGPLAAVAILGLRQLHLVAPSPLWLIPTILVGGQLVTTVTGLFWNQKKNRRRLHLWISSQAILVTATIYTTGWGPALAIGLVLIGQETLVSAGSASEKIILGWTVGSLAAGECLIAVHWVPSLIPVPEVHGLAVLMSIAITFSYRSLRAALVEREHAGALTESRERRFRALLHSSSDLVFLVDRAGLITYTSPSSSSTLGYGPEEITATSAAQLVHPQDLDTLRSVAEESIESPGASIEFEARAYHKDGSIRWLEGLVTNLHDDPDVQGLVINARDITDRRARLQRQMIISDLGRELLRGTSLDSAIASAANAISTALDGCSCRILRPTGMGDFVEVVTGASRPVSPRHGNPISTFDTSIGDPDAPVGRIEVSRNTPLMPDEEQFIENTGGILLSAIVRFQAEEAVVHQAMHDPLTGLPNRALFNDRLEYALSRQERFSDRGIAVMIVDLDGFKNVNDGLGHPIGDALLINVADRFKHCLRGCDTIARLGGDEFAVLFDDLEGTAAAEDVARRILESLVNPFTLPDQDVAIGASIGIAVTRDTQVTAARLVADADSAMYRAKRAGKGCYRTFQSAMRTAAVHRMTIEQELRSAIRNQNITVLYQPIIDTVRSRIFSFEALARWNHPSLGFIPPTEFIPLAEETGLIIELGSAVLLEACTQASHWTEDTLVSSPSIAVNVSRLQLARADFAVRVKEDLRQANLDPSRLIVEVTESILASESGNVITNLGDLRSLGVRVAIDDFGTGYSSLAALSELPIDILKIDKRFIDALTHDRQGRGFVSAILQLARTLNVDATAEGVETRDQYELLAALGCPHVQGFFFAQPMPIERARQYLADSRRASLVG